MALMALAFLVFAAMTFSIVMYLTRPSATDRAIRSRLDRLREVGSVVTLSREQNAEYLKRTSLSEIGWLDALLHRWRPAGRLSVLLAQADSSWKVSTVLLASAILAAMGFGIVYYWTGVPIPALIIAVVAGSIPVMALRFKRDRRLTAFNCKLPDALDLMSRALRAGHAVSAAIEIVAEEAPEPVRSEFDEVHKQQNFGIPNRDAMLQLGRRVPSTDLQVVITAILVQKETGGKLVEILERTTAVLRDRQRIQGELRIHTAQGRLTGWILCLLPFIMFCLISLTNPGYGAVLVHDPMGRKLAYAGVTMMAMGGLMIRKIVRIRV
jgi:tight adherence protein B